MSIRLKATEKLTIITNLATTLGAGIPLLESVESLRESATGNAKKIIVQLLADLNEGRTIADSLARWPAAFDPVTVNLLRASEGAGNLVPTLKNLSVSIKKDIEFIDKVTAAAVYPTLVVGLFVGVLILILTFVIPRIATVFSRLSVALPLPTRILIIISNFLLAHYIAIIVAIGVLVFLMSALFITKKRWLVSILFRLPLISRLAVQVDLTRFTRSLSLLLNSGIPITAALELGEHVVAKQSVARVIATARGLVESGKQLSAGFKNNPKIIPPMMVRIIEAGEASGTLEQTSLDLAQHFDDQVSKTLKKLTALLEPVMLIVVGIFVGAIMLAIIAPIYGLIGQIR